MRTESRTLATAPTTSDTSPPLEALLNLPSQSAVPPRAEGIAVGRLEAIDADGLVRVSIPAFGLTDVPARSLVTLLPAQQGSQVALGFQGADPFQPIVLGLMLPTAAPQLVADGQQRLIEATESLELRCGQASIHLLADGRIELRGTYITSHASATQRIRGGSVQIN